VFSALPRSFIGSNTMTQKTAKNIVDLTVSLEEDHQDQLTRSFSNEIALSEFEQFPYQLLSYSKITHLTTTLIMETYQ
jgi:hypothetical protein